MRRALLLALAALTLAPAARAEPVTSFPVDDALLALTPSGTPVVAYLRNGAVTVSARLPDGWREDEAGTAEPGLELLGFAVGRRGPVVLLESGTRIVLLTNRAGWRRTTIAAPAGTVLGPAGLALDRSGDPVVAYALLNRRAQSFLRLIRRARGGLRTTPITRAGFPPTPTPPAAAPVVLASGAVHVLEVFGGGAIEWRPTGRTWTGQILPASSLGLPLGPADAVVRAGVVYSSWTDDYPSFGETHVVLVARGSSTVLHTHAFLIGMTVGPAGPEIAANDWFDVGDARLYVGLVLGARSAAVGLDGRLAGYAAGADALRHFLVAGAGGLAWYATAGLPRPVTLRAARAPDGAVALTGTAPGASTVSLYRADELLATIPVAADGSFALTDAAAGAASVYRAVAADTASGLPLAALARL